MEPSGRLELTWTNKHLRLLADENGGYTWVPPSDYRVAEVRLLHDVETVGETRPDRERAQDNLLIRGDALNALTSLCELPELAREYVGKVKLAYLDPPFNTQQAFEHYDDALEHSVWLTMMRDRLLQIRKLLAPDGSVWVHCDDSEQAYLKVMMDEVFGRDNFVATVAWRSTDNSNNDARQFSTDHNYLIVFSRSLDWRSNPLARTAAQTRHFANADNDPRGPWFDGNPVDSPNPRENLKYTVSSPAGKLIHPPPNGWRWQRKTLDAKLESGEIRFSEDGTRIIRRTFLRDLATLPPSALWAEITVTGTNRQAKYELKKLFNLHSAQLFPTPKPERLMQRIIHIASNPGDVVLDCFAGSGTTAAVAQKLGRRWVTVEASAETVETFTRPRLSMVVAGDDPGGITKEVGWEGGGGLRVLEVAPSMFAVVDGRVWLADWAVDRELAEATAAQLGYDYEPDPPFAGRKGRTRLAVVDGLVNGDVVELLVGALERDEKIVLCGTAVDPEATQLLRTLRPGSRTRKIPASILAEYRIAQDWRAAAATEPQSEPAPA